MNIQILALSKQAIDRCDEIWGEKRWKVCAVSSDAENCKDVILSPAAIIKINGDILIIDLGGKKEMINSYEFFKIEIM